MALASALGAQLDMPVTGIRPFAFHVLWPLAVMTAVTYGRIRDYFGL